MLFVSVKSDHGFDACPKTHCRSKRNATQGADAAAKELNITIEIKYTYGGQFYSNSDITAVMDTWYAGGTEVVFACGGGIYTSAAEAAKKVNGKVISIDVYQAAIIDDACGEGITVTSAMKGLAPTTIDTPSDVVINSKWSEYAGKIDTLGLVSDTDTSKNYVQMPIASTQFAEADYNALGEGYVRGHPEGFQRHFRYPLYHQHHRYRPG